MVATADPERKQTLAQYFLKINGAKAAPSIDSEVSKIVVDERLDAPTMVEVHFHLDLHQSKIVDESTLKEGTELEIVAGKTGDENSLAVVKITAIEVNFDDQTPDFVVRGYDRSFSLYRDVKSRSFLNQSDSDIANKIAGESGLTATVDSTDIVYDYLLQYAQTNYEFLLERARRIGYELRIVGKELQFKKPKPAAAVAELEMGVTLKRFSPRLSVAEQVDKVEVRGWDPKAKEALVATASNGNATAKTGISKTGTAAGNDVWGTATKVIPNRFVTTQNDGTKIAQAALDDLIASYVQASGECTGDAKMRVGAVVKIKGAGTRFSGEYYLTAVRHTIDKVDGHKVQFTASTHDASSLSTLFEGQEPPARAPHMMIGVVTNNDDPDKMGRVKVKFPTLFDQDESFWARLISPNAGKERGFYAVPEVNDEVMVAFEGGDPNNPYVLGQLWNGKDLPPKGTAEIVQGGVVNQRIWRSRTGHLFVFDDSDGKEAIQIIDKTEKNKIEITSSDNKLKVTIEGDIEVTSNSGKITMTAPKDISIESTSGKVSIKGVTTAFEAQQSGTLKTGTSLDVNAGTSLSAKGGSTVEVSANASAKFSGASVDVQAQGITNVKGSLVNIN